MSDFPAVKLHVVSGKGGTGKTTLAAALALALAAGGRQVLLTEVEGRQGIAQLFDTPPLPYEERRVAVAHGGGEVYALAIDPEQALLEYLEQFYNLRRTGSMLKKVGAIDFATTIAPGVRDVLLTGKVMEAATRERRGGGRLYDAVVLDAPPTGRIARFLNVNTEVAALTRMGPVRNQADSVMQLLRSAKTAVHLVTVLEEMPVQETADGVAELQSTGLPVGAVLVNMVREPLLPKETLPAAVSGRLDPADITRGLKAAGIDADKETAAILAAEASDHANRVCLEEQERGLLRDLDRPTYEFPLIADATDSPDAESSPSASPTSGWCDVARSDPKQTGSAQRSLEVDALLDTAEIIVCCGAGGVGKTTTAAALALRAAEQGRKVCVLTIDPARRLAQSMGLTELDNTPRRVAGIDGKSGGSLDAMMLDMKRTFDEIVLTHADEQRAEQIFANPFYVSLSSSFSGTQEYMAMEKLGQLKASGTWELIVVDTPPSRSALDFLDAPQRLGRFLDGRMIRMLTAPARAGGRAYLKVFAVGMKVFTDVLNRILGGQALKDLSLFVSSLETMFGGFRERADETYKLLKESGTSFVVVAVPEQDALREAAYFVERLETEHMPLAGLVLNRVHSSAARGLSVERSIAAAEALEEQGDEPMAAGVLRVHADRLAVATRDDRRASRFSSAHPSVRVVKVAAQAADIHDLDGLRAIGEELSNGLDASAPRVAS